MLILGVAPSAYVAIGAASFSTGSGAAVVGYAFICIGKSVGLVVLRFTLVKVSLETDFLALDLVSCKRVEP
jgi:hypothetical protein